MINNIKELRIMKLGQGIKSALALIIAIGFLIGMAFLVRTWSKNEPTGYYTAQDTLDSYNIGYRNGAENMRQALKKQAQDLTVKSCQE